MDLIDFTIPYDEGREHWKGWGLSMVGGCITQLVLLDLGLVPTSIDAKTQRLFKVGGHIEDQMVEELIARGWDLHFTGKDQIKVTFEGKNGYPDGLISTSHEHHNLCFLWECKSMRKEAFYKLKSQGIMAYEGYYQQAVTYAEAMRKRGYHLDGIYFTVQNKNDQEIWQDILDIDFQTIVYLKKKMRKIRGYVKRRMVPQPKKSWKCNYCGFKQWCWSKKKGVRDTWQKV
ncbi:MAG: Dna2/Cas4 domain-containing protein [Candidatus Thorarchaeota archaeon]|jgi:hypothetical protein